MQPEELYELDTDPTQEVEGAALLVHLEGFMDAGAAGRLLTEHLLDAFEHTTVARFDTDRLLDYRSRRPLMTFDGASGRATTRLSWRCSSSRTPRTRGGSRARAARRVGRRLSRWATPGTSCACPGAGGSRSTRATPRPP